MFICFFFFGKGISVAEKGTPFSQQVICGSWQTEGGIAILVQVTLRVNLRLCHMLLSVGAGLAECDWSVFSFLFSSTGWTYLCWWCWKAEDFACESFTSHLNRGSQAAGKHCYQKSICWPEREIAVLLDRYEAVPEQGLSGLGSEGDRAAGDQQGFAGTRRDCEGGWLSRGDGRFGRALCTGVFPQPVSLLFPSLLGMWCSHHAAPPLSGINPFLQLHKSTPTPC